MPPLGFPGGVPQRIPPDGACLGVSAVEMAHWASWAIIAAATAGVIIRPFAWPEFLWAGGGAILLVVAGLLSAGDALRGITEGHRRLPIPDWK